MKRNADELPRSTGDFILFGLTVAGFVLATAGVITTSLPACLTGLFLLAVGVGSFMLKNPLRF
jgi:hypothetical protein